MFNVIVALAYMLMLQKGGPLPSDLPKPKTGSVFTKIPRCTTPLGGWVKYRVVSKVKAYTYDLWIGFVGRPASGKGMWMEMEITYSGMKVRFKLLVEGQPTRPGKVKKVIMRMGGLAPVSLPVEEGMKTLPVDTFPLSRPIVLKREETVKTAAGTFRARRYEGTDVDGKPVVFWFSKKVPVWGMVKHESSRLTMTLVGYGNNAKSELPDDAPRMRF